MQTKKNKWIITSIALVIALTLLVLTMGNAIMARLAPKQYVLLSLLKFQKKIENQPKYTQVIRNKNKNTSLDLSIEEISGLDQYYEEILGGLAITLLASSNEAQEILLNTNLEKHGSKLIDLSLYSSKDQLGVKIPGLLDQYVTVNLDQFKDQYDQTKLSPLLGDIKQEELDYFKDAIDQTRKSITGQTADSLDQLSQDYHEALEVLVKTIDTKFIETTKSLVNNKSKKAYLFSIHLGAKDILNFQTEMIKATFKNDYISKNIDLMTQRAGEDYEPGQIQALLLEELNKSHISDIQINCIIDKKKQILEAELMGQIISDDSFGYYVSAHVSDGLVFKLQENGLDILISHLQLKKDFETKDYNRSFLTDISLVQNPNINIKLSGNFSIENLKDTPLVIVDEQKLDLFSLGGVQMLDLILRLGNHFYQLGNLF